MHHKGLKHEERSQDADLVFEMFQLQFKININLCPLPTIQLLNVMFVIINQAKFRIPCEDKAQRMLLALV